ncbi:hypothetical protein OTU49_017087, partial [Cherax quadricarinatus]
HGSHAWLQLLQTALTSLKPLSGDTHAGSVTQRGWTPCFRGVCEGCVTVSVLRDNVYRAAQDTISCSRSTPHLNCGLHLVHSSHLAPSTYLTCDSHLVFGTHLTCGQYLTCGLYLTFL